MNSNRVSSNFLWRFAERSGAQGVSFIVQIILARLLAPEVFGTIALITVFTNLLTVFIDSGFGNALIQKKDADHLDFSTVFYFNVSVCSILYVLMFIASPYIANYYSNESLTPVIRVLSLTLVISGLKNVQQAYVSKTLQFRRFFFATLGGTICAAIIGIAMAYLGFGVWALVAQQLVNATVGTLVLWIAVKWRPKMEFSISRLKPLFSFGWKLLASALLEKLYTELWQLIIGKKFSTDDLAYYNRGHAFPNVVITNINTSIDSVLLPVMSREQDDPKKIKAMTRRSIKTSTYIIVPLMMGIAFTGTPLVRLILTKKWLPSVPYMSIFCITGMFYPIHTANLNAIKALGRSDLFLRLEIIKKVIGLLALFISMRYGVMAMAYSLLFTSVCSQIINSWPNRELLNYGYLEQFKDIFPNICLAVVMGLIVFPFRYLNIPDIFVLFIQIVVGIIVYLFGSIVFKFESFIYLKDIVFSFKRNVLQKCAESAKLDT